MYRICSVVIAIIFALVAFLYLCRIDNVGSGGAENIYFSDSDKALAVEIESLVDDFHFQKIQKQFSKKYKVSDVKYICVASYSAGDLAKKLAGIKYDYKFFSDVNKRLKNTSNEMDTLYLLVKEDGTALPIIINWRAVNSVYSAYLPEHKTCEQSSNGQFNITFSYKDNKSRIVIE